MSFFAFISEQYLLVGLLLVLIYVFVWTEQKRGGKKLSISEATRMLNKDEAVLLDVRDSGEFKAGHIVNAINIPFNKINERWQELEPMRSKLVIVADKMGQHSGNVGNILRSKQFQVSRLSGGMMEWQSQNLPVVKS